MENILKLFPARVRRSLTRGIDENKRKLAENIKASKAGKNITIRTHYRDLIILPYMVGVTLKYHYAFQNFDPTRHVRAAIREKTISHKHAREIAVAIKGLNVEKAREYLIYVTQLKRSVPFRRFKNQVGHKSDPGTMSGRYPQKAATEVLKLLDNLESNAEYKGMDLDRLKIINATVHKGRILKRFIPRAQGRATPKNNIYTHMELVAKET